MFTPPHASDARRAWLKGDLRVEAAAFAGRPVWFHADSAVADRPRQAIPRPQRPGRWPGPR